MLSLLIFLAVAAASFLSVGQMRRWLIARQMLDIPNDRSSHEIPTPRGGGLPVVVLVLLTALVWTVLTRSWLEGMAYCASGAIIAFLGWRDDVRSLPARVRFLVQGLVGLGCVLGLGAFPSIDIPLLGELRLGWASGLVTLLWIVGLTNAFNFMDGIDGIIGGSSAAAGLGWLAILLLPGAFSNGLAFYLALAVVAANLGFLFHNWSPAKIFMGDVCSTFLGFTFAVLPLLAQGSRGPAVQPGDALLVGTAVLWALILDTGLTFARRLLKGERVFSAHRTHIYQRLVISGLPVPLVSGLYIFLTLAGGSLAAAWLVRLPFAPPLLVPGMLLAWAALYFYTRYVREA